MGDYKPFFNKAFVNLKMKYIYIYANIDQNLKLKWKQKSIKVAESFKDAVIIWYSILTKYV